MIGGTKQSQSSGDNSNNFQAGSITIINTDEGTIRSIVDRQIEARLSLLTGEAFDIYKLRCRDFTDGLVDALKSTFSPHVDRLREPSVQFSINEAQKAYGESGEDNIKDLLITLIGKMCSAPNNILDRIHKDAIDIVRKINTNQLGLISLHVSLWNLNDSSRHFSKYIVWLVNVTKPFFENLPKNVAEIQHLEHIGVGNYQIGANSFRSKQRLDNIGLFQKGISYIDMLASLQGKQDLAGFITPSMHNVGLVQLGFKNAVEMRLTVYDSNDRDLLNNILESNAMQQNEIDQLIIENYPEWGIISNYINKHQLDNFHVTIVGQALALINIESKCGIEIGTDAWVQEA